MTETKEAAAVPQTKTAAGLARCAVGLPCYGGKVDAEFTEALIGLTHATTPDGKPVVETLLWAKGDSLVPRARNRVVAEFLKTDIPYLLFLDTDLVFNPAQVARLLSHRKKLVCGMYPKKQPVLEWVVNAEKDAKPDSEGLMLGTHGPTGAMLIHRSVFNEMIEHYGDEIGYTADPDLGGAREYDFFGIGVIDGRYLSEDWWFCRKYRDIGGEVWIDTQVQMQHIGKAVYPLDPGQIEKGLQSMARQGYEPTMWQAKA